MPQFVILTVWAISKGGLYGCHTTDNGDIPIFFGNINESEINQTLGAAKCHNNSLNMSEVEFYQISQLTHDFGFFHVSTYYWFRLTYFTTFLGCISGITKFLDYGPTRILSDKLLKNFLGWCLVCLSVIVTISVKALGLGHGDEILEKVIHSFTLDSYEMGDHHQHNHAGICTWLLKYRYWYC